MSSTLNEATENLEKRLARLKNALPGTVVVSTLVTVGPMTVVVSKSVAVVTIVLLKPPIVRVTYAVLTLVRVETQSVIGLLGVALQEAVTTDVSTLPGKVTVDPLPGCVTTDVTTLPGKVRVDTPPGAVWIDVYVEPGAVTVVAHCVMGPMGVALQDSVTTEV